MEKMFGEERKVVLDGLMSDLATKCINEKEDLRAKQEQQIKDLQSKHDELILNCQHTTDQTFVQLFQPQTECLIFFILHLHSTFPNCEHSYSLTSNQLSTSSASNVSIFNFLTFNFFSFFKFSKFQSFTIFCSVKDSSKD